MFWLRNKKINFLVRILKLKSWSTRSFAFSKEQKLDLFSCFQSILKVLTDDGEKLVPVTPETTCADVLECLRDPGEDNLLIKELWRESG